MKQVALAMAEQGDITEALNIVHSFSFEFDLTREAIVREIAGVQADAGDISGALKTIRSIQKRDHKIDVFTALLHALNKDFSEAIRVARTIKIGEAVGVFIRITWLRAKAGDIKGALETALHIPESRWRGLAQYAVVHSQADGGDIAAAQSTAASIADVYVRNLAFAAIARAQAKMGHLEAALQTSAVISSSEVHDVALEWIALEQVKKGDITGALQTIAPLRLSKERVHLAIIEDQAKSGDIAGANATAAAIKDQRVRQSALWSIAVVQAKAGDASRVLSVVRNETSEPYSRVFRLLSVVIALLQWAPEERGEREMVNFSFFTFFPPPSSFAR